MRTISILMVLTLLAGLLVTGCAMENGHHHGDEQTVAGACPKCGAQLDEKNYCKRCQEYIGDPPQ